METLTDAVVLNETKTTNATSLWLVLRTNVFVLRTNFECDTQALTRTNFAVKTSYSRLRVIVHIMYPLLGFL